MQAILACSSMHVSKDGQPRLPEPTDEPPMQAGRGLLAVQELQGSPDAPVASFTACFKDWWQYEADMLSSWRQEAHTSDNLEVSLPARLQSRNCLRLIHCRGGQGVASIWPASSSVYGRDSCAAWSDNASYVHMLCGP